MDAQVSEVAVDRSGTHSAPPTVTQWCHGAAAATPLPVNVSVDPFCANAVTTGVADDT